MISDSNLKARVRDFWDEASCGEVYAAGDSEREYYRRHRETRYRLEPYIGDFARFEEGRGKDVLEVGVGMGADHVEWARSSPRSLVGIDLTPRAVEHTTRRLAAYGLESDVRLGDGERLPLEDDSFDLVYSWGVLHHSPDTAGAVAEVLRVLRPGGLARVMIYHRYSLTGYMLWARYGLLRGRPFYPLQRVFANHLESPGTKAYSVDEARAMFGSFSEVGVEVKLSFADLLEGEVGQAHGGPVLTLAKKLWPRSLLRRVMRNHGLLLLIEARK